ncbi:UDP-glucose 4-epimerase [Achromobacter deleyi]|uniref:UDP-glucose 4-epimerase GalE n=1 Tax=Achromobacter deleyi TaxID=1353891 RepID=UPI0014663A79|nr:UDP-glucose 4-epimerase GalE [Achromobacter deleyi]CAB3834151.1 UDP-glucose 4-epimerase [Achromobacter deleyi]CAB3865259.1 UDP-glucose 4-epimerase [Achromobacter deleyi]
MILVTGGLGYIGSHTCVSLSNAGQEVLILDNLSNSKATVLQRLREICPNAVRFEKGDIRDKALLSRLFAEHEIEAVMHFAGLKAVGESTQSPISYYDNNVVGTLCLLEAMTTTDVKTLVFSSSATVYGDSCNVPIPEDSSRCATNPYGRTKLFIEDILADLHASDTHWRIARLRYFNPVGAHESGRIGEDPLGIPANLMPYVAQVATGHREYLNVFGGDYPTPDGTGVRDYAHVMDLAEGHVAALRNLQQHAGMLTVNLGTGRGTSVLDLVTTFSQISERDVPYKIVARRPGDVAQSYAAVTQAEQILGWKAQRHLSDMCADHWRWQIENPDGYPES